MKRNSNSGRVIKKKIVKKSVQRREEKIKKFPLLNGVFHHPFTSLVIGPSQSGKSTFVQKLMLQHKKIVGVDFEHIFIFLGTSRQENPTLNLIYKRFPDIVRVFNLKEKFPDEKKFLIEAPFFIKSLVRIKGKKCFIFDDLMKEMGNCDILADLFTKYSSHNDLSIIYITQNLFHKGKCATLGATLYRNTHVLVVFKSFFDRSTLSNISSRMFPHDVHMKRMLSDIQELYRYVVLRGDFNTPEELRVTSDYFSEYPIVHYKSFVKAEAD